MSKNENANFFQKTAKTSYIEKLKTNSRPIKKFK